jgi:flagellar protein FliO/FliZ
VTELALRLVFSLAIVVGILLLLAKVAGRRFQGKAGAAIQVVHRQPLSRGSGVAVVTVGDRVLLLGTTEHQVTLLTELEPDELGLGFEHELQQSLQHDHEHDLEHDPAAEEPRVRAVPTHRGVPQLTKDGPLAGSVLSPETWRQALRVARGTTRDAS